MPTVDPGSQFHAPSTTRSEPDRESQDAEPCSLTVWRDFYVDGDTIAFTMGRAPEFCSEAPRMIWTNLEHRRFRQIIPPLFNWNVEALWCTERFLVFGLAANYEGGVHDERLAFWDLASGQIVLGPGIVWDDGERVVRSGASLRTQLPGWRGASIAETPDGLVFAKGDTTLAFWPSRHGFSIGSRKTK